MALPPGWVRPGSKVAEVGLGKPLGGRKEACCLDTDQRMLARGARPRGWLSWRSDSNSEVLPPRFESGWRASPLLTQQGDTLGLDSGLLETTLGLETVGPGVKDVEGRAGSRPLRGQTGSPDVGGTHQVWSS